MKYESNHSISSLGKFRALSFGFEFGLAKLAESEF